MEESRKQKLDRLEQGKETIYHELGHLLGYILANTNEVTFLGKVKECSIGLHRNCVMPKKKIYHIDNMPTDTEAPNYKVRLEEEMNKLQNNTKNLPRTIAWICEVYLGCVVQSTFVGVDFSVCANQTGRLDLTNLSLVRKASYYTLDRTILKPLCEELEHFVKSKNIVHKLSPYVEQIQNEISQTDDFQKTYEGDDLELLYNSVSEILDDDMRTSYLKMIIDYSKKLKPKYEKDT